MMARYYQASLGRFLAVDPGNDTALGDPQSWNKYAYVRNNPIGRSDPTGRFGIDGGSLEAEYRKPNGETAENIVSDIAAGLNAVGEALLPFTPILGEAGEALEAAGAALEGLVAGSGEAAEAGGILENAARGKAGEQVVGSELAAEGKTVLGSQVQADTAKGTRVIDHLVDDGGKVKAVEVKTGGATRNASQLAKDKSMASEGATLKGKNAPGNLKGQKIKIETEVRKPKGN
jgi:uncharacterized protein RhaS with RHS repeats